MTNDTIDFQPDTTDAPASDGIDFQPETPVLASTFADPKDLSAYDSARARGATERQALSVGDNGVGAWNDRTATNEPMVALPSDTPGLAHNRPVEITGPDGRSVVARVADKMNPSWKPSGKAGIDLNPGAAAAIGHPGGVYPVSWRFVDQPGDNQSKGDGIDFTPDSAGDGIDFSPDPGGPMMGSTTQAVDEMGKMSDDQRRAIEGTQQAQQAMGLIAAPLNAKWKGPLSESGTATSDEQRALEATGNAQTAIGLIAAPLNENWKGSQPEPIFLPQSASQIDAADAKTAEKVGGDAATAVGTALAPVLDNLQSKLDRYGVTSAVGQFDSALDNGLAQFHIPATAVRQFIADAGHQFGGDAIEGMLPEKWQVASRAMADSVSEQTSALTEPGNIKILGTMALMPDVGIGKFIGKAVSLGFGAQAGMAMWQAAEQARTEKDPQKFWHAIGNAVGAAAIATLATAHGINGIADLKTPPKPEASTPDPEAVAAAGAVPPPEPINVPGDTGRPAPAVDPNAPEPIPLSPKEGTPNEQSAPTPETAGPSGPGPVGESASTPPSDAGAPEAARPEVAGDTAPISEPAAVRVSGNIYRGTTTDAALEKARMELAPDMSPEEFADIAKQTDPEFKVGLTPEEIAQHENPVTSQPESNANAATDSPEVAPTGVSGESPPDTGSPAETQGNIVQPPERTPARSQAARQRASVDEFGTELTPVSSFIINDVGGMMSKTTAKGNKEFYKRNSDLWEGAPSLAHPTHGKIYKSVARAAFDRKGNPKLNAKGEQIVKKIGQGGETPDVVANEAYKAGLIHENTVEALWEAISKESHTAKTVASEERYQMAEGEKRMRYGRASEVPAPEPIRVNETPTLRPGEKQGDLLSKQSEDLTLVGEKGVDHGAAQAQREMDQAAAEQRRVEQDRQQMGLHLDEEGGKLKLRVDRGEGGFIDPPTLADVADFGRRVLQKGMDFAKWSAEMVRHLGDKVAGHLKDIWDSIRGADFLPGKSEAGGANLGMSKEGIEGGGEKSPTGIRNARVDEERAARGLAPRMEPQRKKFGDAWDAAMATADRDPKAGSRLVEDLAKKSRALTPEETALLTHETIVRQHAHDNAINETNRAETPEEIAAARQHMAVARDEVQQLYNVADRAGTESGQSLAFRKLLINDDFTLAKMESTARANHDPNHTASPSELEKIYADAKAAHDRIAELQKQMDDMEAQHREELGNGILDELKKQVGKETQAAAKRGQDYVSFAREQRAKAKARILARRGRLNITVDPLNVAGLVDEVIVGASYLAEGLHDVAEWSKQMVEDFGERVKPYLDEILARAKKFDEAQRGAFTGKEPATPGEIAGQADPAQPVSKKMVFDMARAHVNAGVDGFENVMNAVHADLKSAGFDVTPREVRDIFSDYGKQSFPSKEEDLKKLREYRRLAQLASAIEDVAKGKAPEKTGSVRDKPSQTVREKTKKLRDDMRKAGIETSSPEEQLASQNQARETSLRNQIDDLEKEIATGEKYKPGPSTPDSAEVTKLKERRDALKKQAQAIQDAKPEVKAEKERARLEGEQRKLAKTIEGLKEKMRGGGKPGEKTTATDRPAHPALEPLFQERDNLRAQLKQAGQDKTAAAAFQRKLQEINDRIDEGLAKLSVGDVKAKAAARQMNRPFPPELEAAQQELERVNAMMKEARKVPKSPLESYKKRLAKLLADVKARIAAGDYSRKMPKSLVLDPAAIKMRGELQREQARWRSEQMQAEASARPTWEKGLDLLSGMRRMFVLSGIKTLVKLASYSATKLGTMAATEAAGGVLSHVPVVRQAAMRAPSEGGFRGAKIDKFGKGVYVNALARSYAKFFTAGIMDAVKTVTEGKSDLKSAFGPIRAELPRKWHDFFGVLHEIEKSPLRRASFELHLSKRMAHAMRNGVDVTDGPTQLSMALDAFTDSNRALLMENNRMASGIRQQFRMWEAKSKATGQAPFLGKLAATVGRLELPVLTVPLNYARQALEGAFGVPVGSARLVRAYFKGWDNLKPEEADGIMRNLKNGSIGGAISLYAFLDGYYGWNHFGGYYQPGDKRKPADATFGTIKVAGYQVPSLLLHNPLLEAGMLANTIGRLMAPARGEKAMQIPAATIAGLLSLTEHSPLGTSATKYSEMVSGHDREKAINEHLAGFVVPSFARDVAGFGDEAKRKPITFMDQVRMGIPGAHGRGSVPTSTPSSRRHSSRAHK